MQTAVSLPIRDTRVYSIEEVCYFIAHNIYLLQRDIFGKGFVSWVREELALTELADKLEAMSTREDALKDVVVTICCSCDYFDEPQINEMVHIMEETEHLPRENAVRSRLIRSYRAAAMKVRSRDIRQSYVVRI